MELTIKTMEQKVRDTRKNIAAMEEQKTLFLNSAMNEQRNVNTLTEELEEAEKELKKLYNGCPSVEPQIDFAVKNGKTNGAKTVFTQGPKQYPHED